MINIAIIGLGHIGKIHLATIKANKHYLLKAICDKDIYKYDSLVESSVKKFKDYKILLEEKDLNTIIIATPNNTHFEIAKDAIQNGLNIILEKPATDNLVRLKEIESLSIKKKVKVYYSFHASSSLETNAFSNYYLEKKKSFGELTSFNSFFYDPYLTNNNLKQNAKGLGNCWLDSGINALSVIDRFIPVSSLELIETRTTFINGSTKVIQSLSNTYAIKNQKGRIYGSGTIETAWDQNINKKITYLFFGKNNKVIILDHSKQEVLENAGKGFKIIYSFSGDRLLNHYIQILNDFYELIYNNKPMNYDISYRLHSALFWNM